MVMYEWLDEWTGLLKLRYFKDQDGTTYEAIEMTDFYSNPDKREWVPGKEIDIKWQ